MNNFTKNYELYEIERNVVNALSDSTKTRKTKD